MKEINAINKISKEPIIISEQENISEIEKQYFDLEKWGNILLGASGWQMKIDSSIPTAAADFSNRTIYFGIKCEKFIADSDKKKEELKRLFVFSHELMHFAQALEAPNEYLATFETAKEKGQEYTDKYNSKKNVSVKNIEKSFKTFYNIFLDVNDNGRVNRRNKNLQDKSGKKCTQELYQKLFSRDDLSEDSLNEQFMNAIIMQIMEQNRSVKVSKQVHDLINKKFTYLGKEYKSIVEFVRKEIYSPDIPFKKSLFRIESILMPIFENMLKEDLENDNYNKLKKQEKNGSGEGDGGLDDGINEDDLKDFIKKVLKEDKNLKTSDQFKKQLADDFYRKLEKGDFSKLDIARIKDIMRNTNTVWNKMLDLWSKFFGISTEYIEKKGGNYSSGDLSVSKFVKDLPKFVTEPGSAKPFERLENIEKKEQWKPKKKSVIFAIDLSGSMGKEERNAVQEAYYSIYKSFIQFQRNQIIKSEDQETPVIGYTRNIGFGSSKVDLFERNEKEKNERIIDPSDETLDERIWKSILNIGNINLRDNDDESYLYEIAEEVKKSEDNLEKDEEIMVIIELTDGDPNANVKKVGKGMVKKLNEKKNVYYRSIRIGGSSNDFQDIWGKYGEPLPLKDVAKLKEVFMKIFIEIFSQNNK